MENVQNPFGEELQKYWDLLTPEERRMKFDEYGLYALTPRKFSKPILENIEGEVVIDACCSVGGMTIPMAQMGKKVIAIEIDPKRLALARENAEIFGVQDRVTFVLGDVLEKITTQVADTIFFDGQWMGVVNQPDEKFRLSDFRPNGNEFLSRCFKVAKSVVFRVPANFDFSDLDQFPYPYSKEETVVDGRVVAYTIYWKGIKK